MQKEDDVQGGHRPVGINGLAQVPPQQPAPPAHKLFVNGVIETQLGPDAGDVLRYGRIAAGSPGARCSSIKLFAILHIFSFWFIVKNLREYLEIRELEGGARRSTGSAGA